MTSNLRLVLIPVVSALLCCIFDFANAQQLSCDNLQQIIKVAAGDSTFQSLRGAEKENKYGKSKEYEGTVMLWHPDGYIIQGQYIEYIDLEHHYAYHSVFDAGATGTSAKEETKTIVKMLTDCLGNGWLLKTDLQLILGDSTLVYYLKNTSNYVVLKIMNLAGATHIDCYNDNKNSVPECIYGDCGDYFGSMHFFSEDTYSGTFIDGSLSGAGRLNWYSTKTAYEGSFIDNQIAGSGTMYNENNQAVQTGIFFKGNPVKVDMSNSGCQFGECQTGFGLKILFNAVYIGNFKDGLPDGLGETISDTTVYYGYYQKGQGVGKGILINSKGNYTFGNYVNAVAKGKYEVDFVDKTSLEANASDHTSNFFDENNILTKSGIGTDNAFVENTDVAYLNLKACAKSLKDFYGYRQTGYKEIRGEQNRLLKNLGMQGGYKSTLLFQKIYEASIDVDHNKYYYVTVYISGKSADKTKWVSLYNKYYDNLNNALGNRWKAVTDEGEASLKKNKSSLILQNVFDKSKMINLSINEGGVQMEIH
jgi:hypothetical protein